MGNVLRANTVGPYIPTTVVANPSHNNVTVLHRVDFDVELPSSWLVKLVEHLVLTMDNAMSQLVNTALL